MSDYDFKTQPFRHQLETFESSRDLESFAVLWEQGCVDADTEYLTPDGWVRACDYESGPVMQFDMQTWQGSFAQPTHILRMPCQSMYHLKTKYGIDQMLTPEHPMLYMSKYGNVLNQCTAKTLVDDLMASPTAFRPLPTHFHRSDWGDGLDISDEMLRLQVAVMADGSFLRNASNTTRCVVRLKKDRKKLRLREILGRSNVPYTETELSGDFTKFVFNAPWRRKTYDHDMYMKMSERQARIIASEVLHWDGNQRDKFYSKNRCDAEFVQLVLSSLGVTTHLAFSRDLFTVSLRTTRRVVRGENISLQVPRHGLKYCVGVPSGFLVLRRGDQVFVSGNTGKTKLTIDNIAWLFLRGEIDGLLLIAPPGVERNWITDELPVHMPKAVMDRIYTHHYRTIKAETKYHRDSLNRCIYHSGLAVLCMSYDAFMTPKGKQAAWKFLQKRRCMQVLDEAHAIKSPGTKRSKSIIASGRYSRYRRILTGTPVANGPFDIYTQMKFLDEDFWRRQGINTYAEFKLEYGVWGTQEIYVAGGQRRDIDVLLEYKNLDRLYRLIAAASSRVTKDDVLELPPKLYQTKYFEMSREQDRAYGELKRDFFTEISTGVVNEYGDDTEIVEAPLAIVRLLRLQQITCGYLPSGDENGLVSLGNHNPRLEALKELYENITHKTIVWSRFTNDIDLIMDALRAIGRNPVRYDGTMTDDECAASKEAFQRGDATDFVGNPAKGREGLTLHAARTVIYYNNSFKLIDRLQSEDRAHRIGQEHPVNYIDMVAVSPDGEPTVDAHIAQALIGKFNIAAQITGDRLKEWLRA